MGKREKFLESQKKIKKKSERGIDKLTGACIIKCSGQFGESYFMDYSRKQIVTLSEVAKVAGVSKSAVSKALLGGGGKTTKVSEKNILRIREIESHCPAARAQTQ